MSGHLNDVFNFLEEQERLTRANLIGMGIVCGLDISLDAATSKIGVTKGCGISSEGYLIVEPADVAFASYRDYKLPGDLAYSYFTGKTLWELVPAGESGPATALNAAFVTGKAVVLFLELKKELLRNCSAVSCDDKGSKVTATVRRLLVDVKDLEGASLPELPEVPVPRIHFSTPEDLHDYEKTYREFFALSIGGKTVVVRLADAIGQAFQILKGLMPDLDGSGVSQLSSKFTFPNNSSVVAIQYYYGLLRDLTAAYHELRTALLQQPAICLADSTAFPRHLVLGPLAAADGKPCRTAYIPSPAVALSRQTVGELRFLFERLNQMVKNFDIPPGTQIPIRVTPSLFGLKHLSGKSMPFYFKPVLRQQWDAARKGQRAQEILSWHGYDDNSSPAYVHNPLQFDLEPHNFFRIEGHVGKNILAVTASLDGLIRNHRLPFSILHLDTDAIGDFLARHFAIEHEAGAMRGGTFVVLHGGSGANANLVLCDFALPYRIEAQSSDCCCRVQISECAYEWFDTKQHLSNLVQHTYPAESSKESDKALLAKYYVIVIYRYEIQKQSLLSGGQPEQVHIPIAELESGQLSAIARRLNEKFPGGLVFDHDAKTNKLVVRYFADQTFRIEWGGLQGNQIRYAYTPAHVERWQKGEWKTLGTASKHKVICRLRDEYCTDQYKWLHENACYAPKYPSPGKMATLDDLIKWENMIRARAGKNNLPKSIRDLLNRISSVINNSYNVGGLIVEAVLIGSWANGSWQSQNPLENNFPPGFLALRQKATGKIGASDVDLLVYSESVKLEDVLATLNEDTQIANSGYRINLVFGKKNAQKGIVL